MLHTNEIFDGTYQVVREIGKGGTGVVYLAFHLRLQKYVALKRIPVSFGDVSELRRETDFMKDLHHPYLPQIYDFIYRDGEVYTVMDFIDGTDFEKIPAGPGRVSEKQVLRWFRQLAEVLQYLQSRPHPIIHSDIKPGNLLLTREGNICLIDFNIAVGANQRGKVLGFSANFASPEQLMLAQAAMNRVASPITLDGRSDIYSAGAVMYYLLTGSLPVTGQRNPPLSEWPGLPYSAGLMAVVDKAMAYDPAGRYAGGEKLLHALNHLIKQEPEYKKYLAAQAMSLVLCGTIAAAGVYSLVWGMKEQRMQSYQQDHRQLCRSVEAGSFQDVIEEGISLLNNREYRGILEKQPQTKAAVLHAVGNGYLEQQDFIGAEQFFEEAIRAAPPGDPDLGSYYLDYGFALLKNGKTVPAELAREQAEKNGVEGDVLLLMAGAQAAEQGDNGSARQSFQQVYTQSASGRWRARACEGLAALPDTPAESRVQWLEQAQALEPSASHLRRLGSEALQLYRQEHSLSGGQKALEAYKALCSESTATVQDRLNYAIACYCMERYSDTIYLLRALEQEGVQDYRIDFYLAFSYYSTGNRGDAAACCASAQRKIRELSQKERDSLSTELFEDITWLENRLR